MSFYTFKSAVSVLWHLRYADWNGGYKPCDVKCACVWSKTARSVNFETYCKLDTGLKLVNSGSTPDFFSRGETNASSQQSGNSPDVREQLIFRVMTGSRTSRQQTPSDVGAGSSGQHFLQIVDQASGLHPHWEDGSQAVLFPGQPLDPPDHVCMRVDGLVNIRADGFYFVDK